MEFYKTPAGEVWFNRRVRMEDDAIASIKRKLAEGIYKLEDVPCFCGSNNDKVLKEEDRYGIPHRIVICQRCALVRANPRMDAESYKAFYNDEYRRFVYRWPEGETTDWDSEYEGIRGREYKVGLQLVDQLVDEDLPFPKVIVDIGCYHGGLLDRFKEGGAQTYGVEYNDTARADCSNRGHTVFASLEELIASGVKADLVVMEDVIEHFLDLREVSQLQKILAEDGYLYVFTPGMFRQDPRGYWQLAHTWYFVANTFGWLMEELGFRCTYIDEEISSFWQWQGSVEHMQEPPSDWIEYITDEAEGKEERKLPPFRGVCKFTKKLLYDNMRRNFALRPPDIYAIKESCTGPIAVVGGGPSIDGEWDKLKALQADGVPIITIARMYPTCLAHDITPTYVVSLDCMEEQEKGFATISPTTTHLFASVTRPELIEKVQKTGAPLYLFDSRDDRKIKGLRRDAGYEVATVINSGGTVVITCIAIALTLGYTDYHIFGFDCMFPAGTEQTHAGGIAGESVPQRVYKVDVNGTIISTTPSFLEFARQSLDIFSIAHEAGMLRSVKFYGESLIVPHMWDGVWHEEVVDGGNTPTDTLTL